MRVEEIGQRIEDRRQWGWSLGFNKRGGSCMER